MRRKYLALALCVGILGSNLVGCGSLKCTETMEEMTMNSDTTTSTSTSEESVYTDETYDVQEYETGIEYVEGDISTCDMAMAPAAMGTSEAKYEEEIAWNTEEYSSIQENGFVSALNNPLSTFSADVDTASYSNLRRMIESGYTIDEIPAGAVRIEEMLNYFSYDYKLPKGDEPFGVTMEMAECPWNEENNLLMIGLKTKEIDFSKAAPSNLVFLIDVSGSMYDEEKLPLLQKSFGMLADNLTEKDRVSIVTYAGEDAIVLQGARGDEKEKIIDALNGLEAGGSTNGSAGIKTAYKLAEKYYVANGNNRVILATDGDLNVGVTSESALEKLITKKKESGVFLSVLGFGTGNIKDNKMETLADKGNGNYAYIDGINEARKTLVEEMGATLVTVAKDVKLQVEFNPDYVKGYRLIGYENRALATEDFIDDKKDAGEIGAGHTVTALYEIIPASSETEVATQNLKYQKEETKQSSSDIAEWCTLKIRYKKPEADVSKELEYAGGMNIYTDRPSNDFLFAASVAEYGLVLRDSEYKGNSSARHVMNTLSDMDLGDDVYKHEFLEMVRYSE